MREFAPKSFGLDPDFHLDAVETRLEFSGEYVKHIKVGVDRPQFVVMNYQYINADAQINPDFVVAGSKPKLWGLFAHFADEPKNYSKGNSAKAAKGSQFEIKGLMYNVTKVDVNSRGTIYMELVRADACQKPRCEFFDEVEMQLCR